MGLAPVMRRHNKRAAIAFASQYKPPGFDSQMAMFTSGDIAGGLYPDNLQGQDVLFLASLCPLMSTYFQVNPNAF